MEYEMDYYLNHPPDDSTPWDGDEYIQWLIETQQVPPLPSEEAPDWYSEAPSTFQNAA